MFINLLIYQVYKNIKFTDRAEKGKIIKKKIDLTSIIVCRELSKMHETVYRGELKNTITRIKDNKNDQKGEFVIIVGK